MGINWVITGGLGFIGLNLALRIIDKNCFKTISIIDNETSDIVFNKNYLMQYLTDKVELRGKIKIYNFSIDEEEKVKKIIKKANVLIHLAASAGVVDSIKNPISNFRKNVGTTITLLNCLKQNKNLRIIVASSGAVLGNGKPPFSEQTMVSPISPYGAGKASVEQYCKAFSFTYGLSIICCRFSNVFGPFSFHKKTVVRRMFETGMENSQIHITGDGQQTRDFLYIRDLVDALILISKKENLPSFDIINISTFKETSILEIAKKVKIFIEKGREQEVQINFKQGIKGEVFKSFSDYQYLRKLTKWKPKINISEGLETTLSWFKKNS